MDTVERFKDVIISDSLDGLGTDQWANYLAHALCLDGECRFRYNGKLFEFKKGDLMIVRRGRLIEDISPSEDFRVVVLYATSQFIDYATPNTNYGTKGAISLYFNPIMPLTAEMQADCIRDFEVLAKRLARTDHAFFKEWIRNAVHACILNFFDFHVRLTGEETVTNQFAVIMSRFLSLLEDGSFKEHREVSWYAGQLCVTPKYLSEVSKKVSGNSANYWINRYTTLEICRLLRDKTLTFVQISDRLHFSSPAYFSRYVQNYLGMSPSEYRN